MPAEIYSYGSQLYASLFTNFIIMFLVNYLYLPVFFELQLNSVYEVCTGIDKSNFIWVWEACPLSWIYDIQYTVWIYFWDNLLSRKLYSLHCILLQDSWKKDPWQVFMDPVLKIGGYSKVVSGSKDLLYALPLLITVEVSFKILSLPIYWVFLP